jgi:predicted nucleic acid-binding protein
MGYKPIVIHPDTIQPDESRLYFFDANIWLQLLNRYTIAPDLRPYVDLWDRLAEKGEPFAVVNAVVLSEVVNRFLRNRFDRWAALPATIQQLRANGQLGQAARPNFKRHYRPTEECKSDTRLLLDEFYAYTYFFQYLDLPQESELLPAMLEHYSADNDFNDQYYKLLCEKHSLTLVTHDGDFFVGGIEVVTTNRRTQHLYAQMTQRRPR